MLSRVLIKKQPGRRPITAIAVLGLLGSMLLAGGTALAVHDEGLFELDKDAQNNTSTTPAGFLGANVTAGATAIPVCQTATGGTFDPVPVTDDILLIENERMTVVTNVAGNFGGNCPGSKRTYNVTRGTNASAHTKAGVNGAVSLIRTATKAGTDWDQVYASVIADANDTGDDDKCIALGLVECAYINDGIGPTTFIGGASKDHLPVSGWQETSGASPDKAEILNAYAAKGVADVDEDPGPGEDLQPHQIVYFGMDRYAVDGSTDIGFWFFKGPVATDGLGGFDGEHQIGDVLALATFTQGGATSNIRVFRWVGIGGNESDTIQGPDGTFGDCVPGGSGANDFGCGTVDNTTIEAPWTANHTTKGSSKSGWIPAGGFFEGGVDLTALGLEGCFSSFLAETRSSPEITAILKDFTLGSFEACGSGLTTTPSNAAGDAIGEDGISIGTGSVMVTDSANLNISGVSEWDGTLTFYLCGPDEGLCDANGTLISSHTIDETSDDPFLSDPAEVTSAGEYCWAAIFTSDTPGVPDADDATAGECFTVNPVDPTISTSATVAVEAGQSISDSATLGGTANQPGDPIIDPTTAGDPAGGNIVFNLYGPDDATCANDPVFTSADVPVSGDGTYGPVSTTPSATGTYRWVASYSGDSPNTNEVSGACNDANEVSDVVDARISLSPLTATNEVNDTHTITATVEQDRGSGFVSAPNGTTVTFSLLNNVAGAVFTGTPPVSTCTTTAGQCSVSITTSTAGSVDIHATTTFSVLGVSLTRATGTGGNNSADANKVFVDANITIGPPEATNNAGDPHTFTVTVQQNDGLPAGATGGDAVTGLGPVPANTVVTVTLTNSNGADYEVSSDTCASPGTTAAGTCTVTFTSATTGTVTGNAYVTVTVGGQTLTRDTDPATSAGSGPGGSGPAVKHFVSLQPTMDTAQRFVPNDVATITVAAGAGDLDGNVVFKLFVDNDTCEGDADYTSDPIDIATGSGTGLSRTVMSDNTTAYDVDGTTFHWVVEYDSDKSAHQNVTSGCGNEHSSITISNGVQQPVTP